MMSNFIDQISDTIHRFTVVDIAIYKLYLIVAGFIIALIFPVLLTLSWIIYACISLICIGLFTWILSKKEGNFYKKTFMQGWNIHIFRKMTIREVGIFKTGMFAIGLLVATLFPELLTADIARYIGVFAFGLGYFISTFLHKN